MMMVSCGSLRQAIYNLDRPWEAEQKLQAVRATLGRGAGGAAAAADLLRGFRIGEERVRKIVLGSPDSPTLASTPPAWARWRAHTSPACLPPHVTESV